jgi:hypothetical protein
MTIKLTGLNIQTKDGKTLAALTLLNTNNVSLVVECPDGFVIPSLTDRSSIKEMAWGVLSAKRKAMKVKLLDLDNGVRREVGRYKTFFGEVTFKEFWSEDGSVFSDTFECEFFSEKVVAEEVAA